MNINIKEIIARLFRLKSPLGLSDADIHIADMIARRQCITNEPALVAAAITGRALREGHTCLSREFFNAVIIETADTTDHLEYSELDEAAWRIMLEFFSVDGIMPLCTDRSGHLYYYRFREYEKYLAGAISRRGSGDHSEISHDLVKHISGQLDKIQAAAVITAVENPFTVISGGPGTGKTTLVVSILQLLAQQALAEKKDLRISLAAPTGKAANRLSNSIAEGLDKISDTGVSSLIPTETMTLHRLLKSTYDGTGFRHNEENLLPADVIVIDEASMVDIRMMVALFKASSPEAKLILLGDHNQLASVEAGNVLYDICSASPKQNLVTLKKNYRFTSKEGIGVLAQAVNDGDTGKTSGILSGTKYKDVVSHRSPEQNAAAELEQVLAPLVIKWGAFLKEDSPKQALERLKSFRVLCAVHRGWYGVQQLNLLIEKILARKYDLPLGDQFYIGRPVMVLANDYTHNVFNGDIGIVCRAGDQKLVHFEGGRTLSPHLLPEHQSAFALTVHKAQGSEFGQVILVLPDKQKAVITRQLLYTAITRARDNFGIFSTAEVLEAAVGNPAKRYSGLADLLK